MTGGRWEPIERTWHDELYVHCDVCGALIPARMWRFEDGERTVTSCEPACQELYESYVKPVHGGVGP